MMLESDQGKWGYYLLFLLSEIVLEVDSPAFMQFLLDRFLPFNVLPPIAHLVRQLIHLVLDGQIGEDVRLEGHP